MKSIVIFLCILISSGAVCEGYGPRSMMSETPLKLDEFGDVNCEDELARLDRLAVELLKSTNTQAYIIVYAGQEARRNEAKARAARMKFYLARNRGLAAKRIFTVDGGYREKLTIELWLVPDNASIPMPTPALKHRDVKLKGSVRVRGYFCGAGFMQSRARRDRSTGTL